MAVKNKVTQYSLLFLISLIQFFPSSVLVSIATRQYAFAKEKIPVIEAKDTKRDLELCGKGIHKSCEVSCFRGFGWTCHNIALKYIYGPGKNFKTAYDFLDRGCRLKFEASCIELKRIIQTIHDCQSGSHLACSKGGL
jgi:hypothetical protein